MPRSRTVSQRGCRLRGTRSGRWTYSSSAGRRTARSLPWYRRTWTEPGGTGGALAGMQVPFKGWSSGGRDQAGGFGGRGRGREVGGLALRPAPLPGQPLVEAGARLPAEVAAQPRGVGEGAALVAGPGRLADHARRPAGQLLQAGEDLPDV